MSDTYPRVLVVTGDMGEIVLPSCIAERMAPLNRENGFDRRYKTWKRDERFARMILRRLSAS